MKHLPIKLGIFVVLFFAAVLAACLFWKPVYIGLQVGRLDSSDVSESSVALEKLLSLGPPGECAVIESFPEGENAAGILVENWKNFSFEKDSAEMDRSSTLHYAYSKGYRKVVALFLTKATGDRKKIAEAYCERADEWDDRKERDAAITDYSIAILLNPGDSSLYNKRSDPLLYKGKKKEALKDVRKALELDPENAAAHSNLGVIFFEDRDYEAAEKEYRKSLKYDPDNARVLAIYGLLKAQTGDLEGALEYLDNALAINPSMAFAYAYRGNVHMRKGDLDSALRDLNRGAELDPTWAESFVHRARVWLLKGNYEAMKKDLDRCIEINPKAWISHNNRSVAKERLGDLEGALEDIRKSQDINPKSGGVYKNMGRFLLLDGKLDEALECFELAQEYMGGNHAQFHVVSHYICAVLARKGGFEEAKKRASGFMRSAKKGEWDAVLLKYFTTDISEKELITAAASDNTQTGRKRKCGAYFFIAHICLAKNEFENAAVYFGKAVETEARSMNEYYSSILELRKLEKTSSGR
ncbi:MAG: tetratricopeptide repeat protein [Planctomycetota bacterium]|nr:MAG: tetratricopeptide repeat protein [Planctomycetota bacterium]